MADDGPTMAPEEKHSMFTGLNHTIENSLVGRYFKLKERNTKFTTELRAGTVTFLTTSNGIGLIAFEPATLVTLAGCPIEDRAPMYTIQNRDSVCSVDAATGRISTDLGPASPNYACVTKMKMRSASLWLGIMGGIMMVCLMARGFRGAIMTAILFVTFVSWIPNHKASYLGSSSQIEGGQSRYDYFKKVVQRPDTSATDLEMDFGAFGRSQLWAALISFLYLDLLDCTGTFYSMASYINKRVPGFINPVTKTFPGMTEGFCVDATSIWIGALLGIAPLTVYIESATGIREGGRTGITAIMVGFYFLISMFFAPIISSIPPYATGPALILVGALMIENLLDIDWKDYQQSIPAFVTISVIPLTYSIAYGIIGGAMTYLVVYTVLLTYDLLTARLYGKSIGEILTAAKPEVLKPYAVLEADEIARSQARIDAMRRELDEAEASLMSQKSMAEERSQKGDNKGVADKNAPVNETGVVLSGV
ncbi:Adenine/guanine permease AZG1 [Tetrabaena socialis]|uniref:Adenine/guanine permease AZG1 n=1 Tax=Tetrabaena socialis TaxID=47790 RepID=A0A2J8A238_9CHLO|nr:Adenine/guanine permease AZG1 [Tetrabaena socialis]|eukprot:PNH06565.1 Adenine/guanine permease AZG1 [Tetrabaena socialis]